MEAQSERDVEAWSVGSGRNFAALVRAERRGPWNFGLRVSERRSRRRSSGIGTSAGHARDSRQNGAKMSRWKKPEVLEIKMDAEISSYQDDNYDPMKDGPLFVKDEPSAELDLDVVTIRS